MSHSWIARLSFSMPFFMVLDSGMVSSSRLASGSWCGAFRLKIFKPSFEIVNRLQVVEHL